MYLYCDKLVRMRVTITYCIWSRPVLAAWPARLATRGSALFLPLVRRRAPQGAALALYYISVSTIPQSWLNLIYYRVVDIPLVQRPLGITLTFSLETAPARNFCRRGFLHCACIGICIGIDAWCFSIGVISVIKISLTSRGRVRWCKDVLKMSCIAALFRTQLILRLLKVR